jgi:2-keto-4-pentenoate hydratase/2-oxohepta-3-ene-1,7-dioic acid hydratase in catechol pathway
MKYLRFIKDAEESYGIKDGANVIPIKGDPFSGWEKTSKSYPLNEIKILAPTLPSKIVAVALNYYDHARESGLTVPKEPLLFLIPSTAVIGPEDIIKYPVQSKRVDYEAELGIVIKEKTSNINKNESRDKILGYTCANDVTARDLQERDGQWTRSKGFDTFMPLGPYISDELDPEDSNINLKLNNILKQNSNTGQLIFDVYDIVSYVSRIMTLLPGDIIITGTPAGIGPMNKGDKVEVYIDGIGSLINYIK